MIVEALALMKALDCGIKLPDGGYLVPPPDAKRIARARADLHEALRQAWTALEKHA